MKTLLLLRHAKSSWHDASLADHDRPLNERGKRDAPRMGRLLKERGLQPDAVLSSTAKRARKTARQVIKASGYEVDIEVSKDLYLAYPQDYLDALRYQPEEHECVLVVGHNPGLQNLVELLTGMPEPFPTAALAQVNLPIDHWSELTIDAGGELVHVWRPKELDDAPDPSNGAGET